MARRAYEVGLERSAAGRRRAGVHRYAWQPTTAEQRHVDGMSAVAEWFVAHTLGRRWLSSGIVPDPVLAGDVEGGISVRWTRRASGCLIIHEDEPNQLRAVLVVGVTWPLRIAGWFEVGRAKRREWWRDDVRHPAYFVPQSALLEVERLRGCEVRR